MGEYASVDSIDILKRLRVNLCKFAEAVQTGLDEADAEIRRTEFWLNQEQHSHWRSQVQHCSELVTRAKVELVQRRSRDALLDNRSSCVDERKALAAAEQRLAEAEERLANVRHWSRQLEKEAFAYKGASAGLAHAVEADLPRALTELDNMIAALEAYAPMQAPAEQVSQAPPPDGGSARLSAAVAAESAQSGLEGRGSSPRRAAP